MYLIKIFPFVHNILKTLRTPLPITIFKYRGIGITVLRNKYIILQNSSLLFHTRYLEKHWTRVEKRRAYFSPHWKKDRRKEDVRWTPLKDKKRENTEFNNSITGTDRTIRWAVSSSREGHEHVPLTRYLVKPTNEQSHGGASCSTWREMFVNYVSPIFVRILISRSSQDQTR